MQLQLALLVAVSVYLASQGGVFAQEGDAAPAEGADEVKVSLLLEAVTHGDVEGIRRALDAQESIDTTNVNGWTAAHFAVAAGNLDLLHALIEHEINLNAQDSEGYTPLMRAASSSDLEMVEAMIAANANPLIAAHNGDTAHSLAAKRHRVALVIAEASAIHAMEENDVNALLQAIEHGAYVNIHNGAGWTPLMFATAMGNVEAAQFLLRHGAETDRQENDGWTALHFAASGGNAKIAQLLLKAGAHAGIRAGQHGDGMTARELAKEENHQELVDIIPEVVENEEL